MKRNKTRIKVSMDSMEGEIRGRELREVIRVGKAMIKNRKFVSIPIAKGFLGCFNYFHEGRGSRFIYLLCKGY